VRYVFSSIALLVPCFWQARIQAGDLGSHIYNAWLAQRIAAGAPLGLTIVPQSTNVLFDILLKALLAAFGAGAAQRIAVGAAVLVFFWGAFAFAGKLAGRGPWALAPALAMLAYGWVFHMGLFNFYLAMGLSMWALALPLAAAGPLLAVAYTAHGLPVAWAIAVLAWQRLPAWRDRTPVAVAVMGLAAAGLHFGYQTRWTSSQWMAAAGANQFDIYGSRYLLSAWAMAAVWAVLIGAWVRMKPLRAAADDPAVQIIGLTAVGILILPDSIAIPGYSHTLAYIGQRMSLALGVCLCGLAARVEVWRWARYATAAIAVVFFAFLWKDDAILNALEDGVEAAVAQLPPGQRIISALAAPDVSTMPVTHMIDRVCVERCYSYGNYEPSSRQFRVRAAGASPIVVTTDEEANAILAGSYVVQARDVPLYQVVLETGGRIGLRQLQPGQMSGVELWTGL
jgi:hypothetical protein